jgi:hypothetical protein
MLGDTFVLTLASGSKTLPKIREQGYEAEYYLRESLVSYRVLVRHSNFSKAGLVYDRHNVTATKLTFATSTDPEKENTASYTHSCLAGDTFLEGGDALADWLIATSNANLTKLLGWES